MAELIFSSILTFIATECDDFIIFVVLYTNYNSAKSRGALFLGQISTLFILSIFCAFITQPLIKVPQVYTGFTGFIPFAIGIAHIFSQAQDRENPSKENNLSIPLFSLFTLASSITLTSSFDNISVYIPYFVAIPVYYKLLVIITFMIMQCFWTYLIIQSTKISILQKLVSASSLFLIPAILCPLGLWILIKSGTLSFIYSLL